MTQSGIDVVTPSDKLEAVIRSNHYPDAVASRLRLLRDMQPDLGTDAARLYLNLPGEPHGGFDNGRINITYWNIGDGYQVEITSDLDPADSGLPGRVVLVAIRHTPSSKSDVRDYDVLTPQWTTRGLTFE